MNYRLFRIVFFFFGVFLALNDSTKVVVCAKGIEIRQLSLAYVCYSKGLDQKQCELSIALVPPFYPYHELSEVFNID